MPWIRDATASETLIAVMARLRSARGAFTRSRPSPEFARLRLHSLRAKSALHRRETLPAGAGAESQRRYGEDGIGRKRVSIARMLSSRHDSSVAMSW